MSRRFRRLRIRYKSNPLMPHERRGGQAPLTTDAISGARFPTGFEVPSWAGNVDGRNGSVVDLDESEHEFTPMVTTFNGYLT